MRLRRLWTAFRLFRLSVAAARPGTSVTIDPRPLDPEAGFEMILDGIERWLDDPTRENLYALERTESWVITFAEAFPGELGKIHLFEQALDFCLGQLDEQRFFSILRGAVGWNDDPQVDRLIRLFPLREVVRLPALHPPRAASS